MPRNFVVIILIANLRTFCSIYKEGSFFASVYQLAGGDFVAYLSDGIFGALHVPASHDDGGFTFHQLSHRFLADAGVGAGHKEHLAVQAAGAPASSPATLTTLTEQADYQHYRQDEVTPRGYHVHWRKGLALEMITRFVRTDAQSDESQKAN